MAASLGLQSKGFAWLLCPGASSHWGQNLTRPFDCTGPVLLTLTPRPGHNQLQNPMLLEKQEMKGGYWWGGVGTVSVCVCIVLLQLCYSSKNDEKKYTKHLPALRLHDSGKFLSSTQPSRIHIHSHLTFKPPAANPNTLGSVSLVTTTSTYSWSTQTHFQRAQESSYRTALPNFNDNHQRLASSHRKKQ